MPSRMPGFVQNEGGMSFLNNNFKNYFKTINNKLLCHEKMCVYVCVKLIASYNSWGNIGSISDNIRIKANTSIAAVII